MASKNTAAAGVVTFSDDWDSEEPTAVDHQPTTFGRIVDWSDHTGTWTAVRDEDLRRIFVSGDDPTVTCRDMPVCTAVAK